MLHLINETTTTANSSSSSNDAAKGGKSCHPAKSLSQIRLASLKEELLRIDAELCNLTALASADRVRTANCTSTGGTCSLASPDNSDQSASDSPQPPSSPCPSADDYNSIESSFSSGIATSQPSAHSSSSSSTSKLDIAEQEAVEEELDGLTINYNSINQLQSINGYKHDGQTVDGQPQQQQQQQVAMPRRSRSLVDDARLDTQRNKQLLEEIRTEAETTRARYQQLGRLDSLAAPTSPVMSAAGAAATGPPHTIDEADELLANDKVDRQQQQQLGLSGDEQLKKVVTTPGDAQQQPNEGALVRVDVDLGLLEEAREIERSLVDFPRHISDLDHCNHLLIKYEPELDPTHPGFHDLEYRQRRKEVAEVAFNYKFGDKIPCIQYNDKELATWKTIYLRLKEAYTKYACEQHNLAISQLEAEHVYSPNYIPQLQTVSEFLEKKTGWRLRPVAGLLSARDFLSSLAFRVFQTTQYIRHWGNPEHSVEPDCIHELMGHIPMLCDHEFAQFSQELGLASLGASDEQIEKFATLYWFTVEFGLCKERTKVQGGGGGGADTPKQLKCYGAGLLSSYGEMEHALESGKPALKEFVPEETALETYDDSEYQVVYYVANSFEEAKAKIRAYAANNLEGRKFELAYDPYSCTIRELSSYDQLEVFANSIKCDINRLSSAISKLKSSSV